MSDMVEYMRAAHCQSMAERARRRDLAPKILTSEGIDFSSHNGGAHLIVAGPYSLIDFWPGPGTWNERSGKEGAPGKKSRDIDKLVSHCRFARCSDKSDVIRMEEGR